MRDFKKIDSKSIKLGMRFSAPVFFDDGENMFLAEEKSVKAYHLAAIQRWGIHYFLSYGVPLYDSVPTQVGGYVYDLEELEEVEPV